MKKAYKLAMLSLLLAFLFSSCHNQGDVDKIEELEDRVSELEAEVNDKDDKIQELELTLDDIQEKASSIQDYIEEEYYEDAMSELDDLKSSAEY